ncbi:hypothetical protein B0T16DRAFT_427034 [Cercophora newfieldiana]|uniref:Uncharacterized protein n=1 Tax=Cercophora newfieldiana TaxID=92897 RepID=A0AA39YHX4_9PEZI|nr:hypothetical protein B0T16DRAFT_427034 [Cercophora newfieldiana]
MASTTAPEEGTRYSTPNITATAKSFSWEYPVPDNAFWNDLKFTVGRNFLSSFSSPEEIAQLPIDPNSTQSKPEKLELLLRLLNKKIAAREGEASPQTFYDVDYEGWDTAWLGVHTLQYELGRIPEAEQTIRMLADKRRNKANLSHFHSLSVLLFEQGKYAEAEEVERPVLDWLVGRLGDTSPQALGSRRIIARSIWKQGPERRAEAEALFEEVKRLAEESGSGKYAVYKDEQVEETETMLADLRAGRI